MCGIAGYVRLLAPAESPDAILRMIRAMKHRGPDDEGLALIDASGASAGLATPLTAPDVAPMPLAEPGQRWPHSIALGHCRFSIIDLSPAGHQPFWSGDRRVCVAFNGEIYNYVELRAELEKLGHRFHTRCDTEVLVEAWQEWGTGCFEQFVGFWAIALYDARRKAILLSRDRLGKAPLYIARHDRTIWFASEIPAILEVTGRNAFALRKQAVADFASHAWRDVGHHTFYEGIETFPNASFAWINKDGSFRPERFWSLPETRLSERQISIPEAVAGFRARLNDAVAVRLRADVPIGFELSGGLDSSSLVAAAAAQGRHIHAYNVSFPGTPADEEPFARQVRDRYPGLVDYTVLNPPTDDFWANADEYVSIYAEPVHAPNLISNRAIWKDMAGRGIRVSINGAAADEAFAGYGNDYYIPFLRHLARDGQLLALVRNSLNYGASPQKLWSGTFWRRLVQAFGPAAAPVNGSHYLTSTPGSRSFILPDELNPLQPDLRPQSGPDRGDIEQILLAYMGDWRMNYWLRCGNQSYMSVPTEVRCPFLDHRIVEFAFTLPLTYLIRDGWLKWIIRASMADDLPADVVWRRRKMGFPFPYEKWAAESRGRFFGLVGGIDCPFVRLTRLREVYDALARTNPLFLWRVMSLCLWWKRCWLGEHLR